MFDEITYQRGGNLFRMFYHIVGAGPFRAAVHNYLVENAYSTATMADMTQVYLHLYTDIAHFLHSYRFSACSCHCQTFDIDIFSEFKFLKFDA